MSSIQIYLWKSKIFCHSAKCIKLLFCSNSQSRLTLYDPMDCSRPGFPVLHHFLEFAQVCVLIESVIPSNHLILCRPLLLLPSIFPSIRVFSSESAVCIRWPKSWSFSFSIGPSKEYSGWFFLLYCFIYLYVFNARYTLMSVINKSKLPAPDMNGDPALGCEGTHSISVAAPPA